MFQKRGERESPLLGERVGWAAPPHYDTATHKLYWAKQLKFEGEEADTLNYCIRMLGRKGVLELNAVAGINQLGEIDQQVPQILGKAEFKEGSRYADFDPKVATYGIAAKPGFFKLIWVFLLAAKKFVIIDIVAVIAFFKKLFNRRDSSSDGMPGT